MIVLGIDPGYDRVGVAIVIEENRKEKVLFSTCIETNRKDAFVDRLGTIGRELATIIDKWEPTVMAIETLFFQNNKTTAMKVAEARGVINYIANQNNLKIIEIGPGTVKATVTGNGRATKTEVIKLLQLTTNMKKAKHDDEYDAVAVAITGMLLEKSNFPT